MFDPLHFTDKNGEQIQLGDLVVTKNNDILVFVFCIPQHRFGFMFKDWYDTQQEWHGIDKIPEPFVVDFPNLLFYWTPKNKKHIEKYI